MGAGGDVVKQLYWLQGNRNKNIAMEHTNERQEVDENKNIIMTVSACQLLSTVQRQLFWVSAPSQSCAASVSTLAPLLTHLGSTLKGEHSALCSSWGCEEFLHMGQDKQVGVRQAHRRWGPDQNALGGLATTRHWPNVTYFYSHLAIPRQRNVSSSAPWIVALLSQSTTLDDGGWALDADRTGLRVLLVPRQSIKDSKNPAPSDTSS